MTGPKSRPLIALKLLPFYNISKENNLEELFLIVLNIILTFLIVK